MLLAIVEEIQWILDSLVPAGGRRGSRLTAHNRESCGEGAHGSCDRGACLTGCRRTDELCDEVSFEISRLPSGKLCRRSNSFISRRRHRGGNWRMWCFNSLDEVLPL